MLHDPHTKTANGATPEATVTNTRSFAPLNGGRLADDWHLSGRDTTGRDPRPARPGVRRPAAEPKHTRHTRARGWPPATGVSWAAAPAPLDQLAPLRCERLPTSTSTFSQSCRLARWAYTPHSTRYFSCSSVGVMPSTKCHRRNCSRDSSKTPNAPDRAGCP